MIFSAAIGLDSNWVMLRPEWRGVWFVGVLGAGGVGGYLILKRLVTYEAVVSVEPECLIIQRLRSAEKIIIPFADVISYKYKSLRDREELCFKLIGRWRQEKISANNLFNNTADFRQLVIAIEQAALEYRKHHDSRMMRARSFFEKPISTILLVGVTILIGLLILKMIHDSQPIKGNFFSLIGAYITYLGVWLAASKRRNEQ